MKEPKDIKILVVDDEVHMREIVAFDLQKQGYHVSHANSGKEAFEKVKNDDFDLVISDVRMPSGTGIELLKWIKELNALRPSFIFMTAFADVSADEALAQGAEAFLVKPLVREDMIEEVKKVLVAREDRWLSLPEDIETLASFKIKYDSSQVGAKPFIFLGSGGLFFEIVNMFPNCHDIVSVDIQLDCEAIKAIKGYAQIRWVRYEGSENLPAGAGIEFLYLTPESHAQYLTYVKTHQPRAFIPLGYKVLSNR